MEISGKVVYISAIRNGISKTTGNPWKMQDYVIETINEQYPNKMVFNVFGEDKIQQFNISMGDIVNVSFDIRGREYNGKWYNDIRAWKVEHAQPNQPTPTAAPAAAAAPAHTQPTHTQPAYTAPATPAVPTGFAPQDSSSDLPF